MNSEIAGMPGSDSHPSGEAGSLRAIGHVSGWVSWEGFVNIDTFVKGSLSYLNKWG